MTHDNKISYAIFLCELTICVWTHIFLHVLLRRYEKNYIYEVREHLLNYRNTTLHDKVCHWLATGRWWFSPGTLVSSTNKTDSHDITDILLKVVLNTIHPHPLLNFLINSFKFQRIQKIWYWIQVSQMFTVSIYIHQYLIKLYNNL